MPYEISFTDSVNKLSLVVEDGTINSETSLQLPGKNTTSYGTIIAENFLHLLENFAAPTNPDIPVEGQLWYDSTPGNEQLMVYNGTNWIPVNGVNKSISQPIYKTEGDLWIDSENLQLYMFTDQAGWILIGPEFSEGSVTGSTPKVVLGIDDVDYNILQIDVNNKPAVIISMNEFTPKSKIDGFSTVKPGLNLTTKNIPNNPTPKYIGVAEKADALLVNNETVPAGNFLRSDAPSSSSFSLSVLSNDGIVLGRNSEFALNVEGSIGIIKHNVAGSAIDVKVKNDGLFKTIMRYDSSTMSIGVNTDNPSSELDVHGDIIITVPVADTTKGNLIVNSTRNSTQISSGSIKTAGGVAVAKSLTVGENLYLNHSNDSKIIVDKIEPTVDAEDLLGQASSYIGQPSKRYEGIYSKRFYGDLTGNVTGGVTGRAGSANKLAKSSTFRFLGDITAPDINFNGQGELVEFTTTLDNNVIANKDVTEFTQENDLLLLFRETTDIGLKKITVSSLLSTVPITPIGTVVPYAGEEPPTGWLLCNGQEVQRADYDALFAVINYRFKAQELVQAGYFALPDLRGRFVMGMHNMGGIAPNTSVVTNSNAEVLGGTGGIEKLTITESNLPDHKHTLNYDDTVQFHAVAEKQFEVIADGIKDYPYYQQQTEFTGLAMENTQGIQTEGTLNNPLDVLNPFMTLNYIIYAG